MFRFPGLAIVVQVAVGVVGLYFTLTTGGYSDSCGGVADMVLVLSFVDHGDLCSCWDVSGRGGYGGGGNDGW